MLVFVVVFTLLLFEQFVNGAVVNNTSEFVYNITIPENTPVGSVVYEFIQETRVELIKGNEDNRFEVEIQTLKLVRYLDCKISNSYELIINFTKNQKEYIRPFVINIEDVGWWPPIYNETCEITTKSRKPSDNTYPFPIRLWLKLGDNYTALETLLPQEQLEEGQVHVDTDNSDCRITAYFKIMRVIKLEDFKYYCHDNEGLAYHLFSNLTIYRDKENYPPNHGIEAPFLHKKKKVRWTLGSLNLTVSADMFDRPFHCSLNVTKNYQFLLHTSQLSGRLEYVGCPVGKYGPLCQYDCICQNGAKCHVLNGACKCSPGWLGVACDVALPTVTVVLHPADGITIYDEEFRFSCTLYNIEPSSISNATLLHNGHVISRSQDDGRLQFIEERARLLLNISSVRDQDSGNYECRIHLEDGKILSDEKNVTVTGCDENLWGMACNNPCDCQHSHGCDRWTGCQCRDGWAGRYCTTDIEAPEFITCQDNITTATRRNDKYVRVSWIEPQAKDNSGEPNVTSNYSPGDRFSVGLHHVVYTAADDHGNHAKCDFHVDVGGSQRLRVPVLAIVSIVIAFILVVPTSVIVFYRLRRHRLTVPKLMGKVKDVEKKWDAFVSVKGDTEDEVFVYKELYPYLEDRCHYKLNLHLRDFTPGEAIVDNIIEAIKNSRVTILVLSPAFAQSVWCTYEVAHAYHEVINLEHKIIPIMFEDITNGNVEIKPGLRMVLDTISYISWPKHGTPKDKDKFWKKLRQAMPPKLEREQRAPDEAGPAERGMDDEVVQMDPAQLPREDGCWRHILRMLKTKKNGNNGYQRIEMVQRDEF
ncbi:uncharacterized protein [Ptychodera flava]|uniref:uncharacterized protein n=1 Tax=Ptychodera flava TaxID=63121 RepID=UPI00396A51CF